MFSNTHMYRMLFILLHHWYMHCIKCYLEIIRGVSRLAYWVIIFMTHRGYPHHIQVILRMSFRFLSSRMWRHLRWCKDRNRPLRPPSLKEVSYAQIVGRLYFGSCGLWMFYFDDVYGTCTGSFGALYIRHMHLMIVESCLDVCDWSCKCITGVLIFVWTINTAVHVNMEVLWMTNMFRDVYVI